MRMRRASVQPFTPIRSWRLVLLALGSAAILAAPGVFAQTVDPNLWGTNGTVTAIARTGNTVYIGGAFTWVGPITGGGVALSAESGAPLPSFQKVAGLVNAAVPDGEGGWFIGGFFKAVGGLPRSNLAHIRADGGVTSWDPHPDAVVYTIALAGKTVYAGGQFTTIGGVRRPYLAALDGATGAATTWSPAPNAAVGTMAFRGSSLFIGGWFSSIAGETRNCIAELDVSTGRATAWNPSANGGVWALAIRGHTIYAAGGFS